jgi:hypothetical protein
MMIAPVFVGNNVTGVERMKYENKTGEKKHECMAGNAGGRAAGVWWNSGSVYAGSGIDTWLGFSAACRHRRASTVRRAHHICEHSIGAGAAEPVEASLILEPTEPGTSEQPVQAISVPTLAPSGNG